MGVPAQVKQWNFGSKTNFLVGPVVGYAEETRARILVEAASDIACNVEASIDGAVVCSIMVNLKDRAPTAIKLDRLAPGKTVTVAVKLGSERRDASFRTPCRKNDWRIGSVSCNNLAKMRDIPLWEKLATEASKMDYLLHMGDQIYGDESFFRSSNTAEEVDKQPSAAKSAYGRCQALVERAAPATFASYRPQLLELYREVYRATWNYPPVAAVLASVSNLMQLDDHEVVDDLGDLPEHTDPTTWQFYVITAAYQVFLEYQMQLFRDVDVTDMEEKAYYSVVLGKQIGLFMVETRIERSIHKPASLKAGKDWSQMDYLGPDQWMAMREAFAGSFAGCNALLVVSPTPPLFLNSVATTIAGNFSDDVRGSWGASRFRKEQLAFLRSLSDWQGAREDRSVCCLAGDIHVGGFSDCQVVNNGPVINQLVSSAIGNEPQVKLALASRAVLEFSELDTRLKIDHHEWLFEPNYAWLDIMLGGAAGPPPMMGTLVAAKKVATHAFRYKLGAVEEALTAPGCCCTVM